MDIEFVKMHGLGNDFIVIEDFAEQIDLTAEAVEWMCHRNFGIGADGLMLVRKPASSDNDFSWWFRNSDGSIAEMCGNGIRCVAKYVVDHDLVPVEQDVVRVETLAGVMVIQISRDMNGRFEFATVDMGEPILTPALIPTTLGCEAPEDPVVSCDLQTDQGTFSVTCLSMGNPHCVLWVDDVDEVDVEGIGSAIETHPAFPKKTNVEFAQLVQDGTIRLRVWERGVGETLACGTGACATAVAAALECRLGREATVELHGGLLAIRWAEDGHVFMTGPATEVFSGKLAIEEDEG
jgi:diaminopimelate epimerase